VTKSGAIFDEDFVTKIYGSVSCADKMVRDGEDCTPEVTLYRDLEEQIFTLRSALKPFSDAWDFAGQHRRTAHLSIAQLAQLAAGEISASDFQRAHRAMSQKP
jgi:hypothetical protein